MDTKIKIRLANDGYYPDYQTSGSAGADLRAALSSPLTLSPGAYAAIPTGIFIELPQGYEAQVRPRSGLAKKYGVTVLNSPGTIDSDYRGEIQVLLINHGPEAFTIQSGDRVAQLIIAPVIRATFVKCETLSETERGTGGFGHTGIRE